MVHESKVTLIRRYILRIIGNVNNETHGCIWHAAPMSKLKEDLDHHIEHCPMFSHHIMLIGSFIACVRGLLILFTFILRMCNAINISVIVIHHLHRTLPVAYYHSGKTFHPCSTGFQHVQMGIFPYMSHDWFAWVLFITAWHGGREARTKFFTCCDILGPFLHFG